jgi:hypothetical protein
MAVQRLVSVGFLMVALALAWPTFCGGVSIAQTSPASQAAGGTSSAAHTGAALQDVVLIGTPSLIRLPNPWPWEKAGPPCATFRVEADASVNAVDLFTTGLGHTELAVIDDGAAPCAGHGMLRIKITKAANPIARDIAVKVDSNSLSTPGTSMQGTVVAATGTKKLAEFALKVEHPPREEIWTAGLWTLGVIIPAALTFGFGQLVVWLTSRQKQKSDFRDYRLANMTKLHEFFANVDTVIRASQQRPGETVYGLIVANDIFSKMTGPGIRTLSTACVTNDLATIVTALTRLFPEFEKPLAKLRESLAQQLEPKK